MEKTLELRTDEAWSKALASWNASIPYVIIPKSRDELRGLGTIGHELQQQLAFMKFPEFQTYVNLENVIKTFEEDPQRGLDAVSKHEVGHRFCPFDVVTSIILNHAIKGELEGTDLPYSRDAASPLILNLFTDMAINTSLARKGDYDIPWAYQQISKTKKDSRLWRVYGKSMELAWKTSILPEGTKLTEEESTASSELAVLFEKDVLDRSTWRDKIRAYARTIGQFLEDEQKDKESALDDIAGNMPKKIDEKTAEELAKKLAEIGSDGLPTSTSGLKEFREIMAGLGHGDPVQASILFYEMLSRAYDVMFATRPFGRPRTSPFQPVKWQPSMGVDKLDVDYSAQISGRLIPGITTYTWNARKREIHGGLEEVVPNLDIYLDSSGTMPNPLEEISLPVLSGFVATKKAHRKGAQVRVTNFSGQGQYKATRWTRDLSGVFSTLVTYYGGGTFFPPERLLEDGDPKQVLIITDTFLANTEATANAIAELRRRNAGNRVTIYAIHPVADADQLISAGAEAIHGTTPEIFKRTIGKSREVYVK